MKSVFGRSAVAAAAFVLAGVLTIDASRAADATPTPAPSATTEPPSPARIDLAKKILTAVGLKASIDEIVPAMLSQLQGQLSQIHPEIAKPLHETLVSLLPEFNKGEDDVFTDTASVMASRLSEQELQQALAFFQSPTGLKYTASQLAVLEELGVSGGLWREKLTKIIVDRTREELKKKGYTF